MAFCYLILLLNYFLHFYLILSYGKTNQYFRRHLHFQRHALQLSTRNMRICEFTFEGFLWNQWQRNVVSVKRGTWNRKTVIAAKKNKNPNLRSVFRSEKVRQSKTHFALERFAFFGDLWKNVEYYYLLFIFCENSCAYIINCTQVCYP